MSPREDQVRSLIAQDAADWFVASRAGLTADERDDLATWLKASPLHVEEYLALEVIGRDLREALHAEVGDSSEKFVDELLARARHEEDSRIRRFWPRLVEALWTPVPGRQGAVIAVALLGVVSLGLPVLWNLRPVPQIPAPAAATALHFETRHGEQQTHRLADDSILHLNTDTAVTVRYGEHERLVMLTSGEADFEVIHAPERPFRVFAGRAEIVDLGTRFDVRLLRDSTVVTVGEGRVRVGALPLAENRGMSAEQPHAARFVELVAGQQLTLNAAEWPPALAAVDAERTTAWLRRQIVFDHEPLERVAVEFNRYAPKPFEIVTPALRNLQISGVFATDDPDAFIAFLRSLEGVQVEVTATRIRVSQSQASPPPRPDR